MLEITDRMPETKALVSMFRTCFPGMIRKPETVEAILSSPENEAMVCVREGVTAGVIVWNKNVVILFCVLPEFRSAGIGSALISRLEERLSHESFDEIRFCDGFDYLTPGIPDREDMPAYRSNRAFFEKRGYVHSWGECECVDMSMDMSSFTICGHTIGDTLNGVTYRYAAADDIPRVIECTDDGYPDFTPYYREPRLYAPSSPERVLIAETDGIVVGTLMVCFETEEKDVGSVGCTVTRPAYQNRGIATTMVKLGTGAFHERGIPRAYLGYTYTDIIPLYARSGYTVSMRYFMGVKKMNAQA